MAGSDPLLPEDPTSLGAYQIVGRLADHPYGTSYLGRHGQVTVALTLFDVDHKMAPELCVDRVTRLQAAARLSGPHIGRVIEACRADSRIYLVTEVVGDRSLAAAVEADGPLDGAALDQLAGETLAALAAIHEAGFVHGDFRPEHVRMSEQCAWVTGFGIAPVLEAPPAAGYAAPELLGGEGGPGREWDFRADMFAWATTMVYAATGRPPFGDDEPAAVLRRIRTAHAPTVALALSGALRDVVISCLVESPAARPTAADAHRTLADGRPSIPVPPQSFESASPFPAAPESLTSPPPLPGPPESLASPPPLPGPPESLASPPPDPVFPPSLADPSPRQLWTSGETRRRLAVPIVAAAVTCAVLVAIPTWLVLPDETPAAATKKPAGKLGAPSAPTPEPSPPSAIPSTPPAAPSKTATPQPTDTSTSDAPRKPKARNSCNTPVGPRNVKVICGTRTAIANWYYYKKDNTVGDRLNAFALGTDHRIWTSYRNERKVWQPWRPIAGSWGQKAVYAYLGSEKRKTVLTLGRNNREQCWAWDSPTRDYIKWKCERSAPA
jgi:serine/threonine protein kinase